MSNVTELPTNNYFEYQVLNQQLDKVFASNKYLVCTIDENGAAVIYAGDKLKCDDLAFLQKMMNIHVDKMYPHD